MTFSVCFMIEGWGRVKPGNLNGSCLRDPVAWGLGFDQWSGAARLALGVGVCCPSKEEIASAKAESATVQS